MCLSSLLGWPLLSVPIVFLWSEPKRKPSSKLKCVKDLCSFFYSKQTIDKTAHA
jgi:hypothetical protein